MPGRAIEREVVVEAPVEVVWRTITEPDQICQWFGDRVELVAEPGARGYIGFGDQGGPVVVEAVDPPTRFSFRWNHPRGEEPVAGNSMLVEFTLTSGLVFGSPRAATSCSTCPRQRRSGTPTSTAAAGPGSWTVSPTCSRSASPDDRAGR
jgi:uncharacterized protein YndB with AHSA1/START domain